MADTKKCVNILESYERLIKLESEFHLYCKVTNDALMLAREIIEKESLSFKEHLDLKLIGYNNFQHRIDALTNTFVTTSALEREVTIARERTDVRAKVNSDKVDTLARLVYIGLGLFLAIQIIMPIVLIHYFTDK